MVKNKNTQKSKGKSMSKAIQQELPTLINHGIQIIQDIQKGSANSSLKPIPDNNHQSKQSTPTATKSEQHSESPKADTDNPPTWNDPIGEAYKQSSRKASLYYNGSDGGLSTPSGDGLKRDNHEVRDDENSCRSHSRDRGSNVPLPDSSSNTGNSESTGTGKSESGDSGYNLSDADAEAILLLDQVIEHEEETGIQHPGLTIKEPTGNELAELLSAPPSKLHKRLRGIKEIKIPPKVDEGDSMDVKKGIEGSTVLTQSMGRQSSEHGATPSVRELEWYPELRRAYVDNAQESASSAESREFVFPLTNIDQLGMTQNEKLNTILENQELIIKKLRKFEEIKAELSEQRKMINNLALAVSTVENYIASMMLIIPGSGQQQGKSPTQLNPDLKPVIGRDQLRGLREVAEKKKRTGIKDLDLGDILGEPTKVDPKFTQPKLDFSQNNAANFIPTEDDSSYRIIYKLILNRVSDPKRRQGVMDWVKSKIGKTPIKEIYTALDKILN
nr:phosphoprotein [Paramyxoviridae sp.]